MVGRPDPRQHEQLWGVEHAAGQQHLASHRRLVKTAAAGVLDADRARSVEQDPRRERVRLDHEVGPPHRRPQKRHGGAAAPAVLDGPLAEPEAFRLLAVVVLGERPVRLARGVEPAVEQRIAIAGADDGERAVAAPPGVLALLPALAALEVGEDLGVRPAAAAVLRPPVVVTVVAAHVGHDVDRRAAAEHLAAHRLDPAVVQSGLGLGVVAPVEHPMLPDLAEPDRDVDQGMQVAPARFEHQHADGRIGGETVGEDAARGAGADDDVVVVLSRGHRLVSAGAAPRSVRPGAWARARRAARRPAG